MIRNSLIHNSLGKEKLDVGIFLRRTCSKPRWTVRKAGKNFFETYDRNLSKVTRRRPSINRAFAPLFLSFPVVVHDCSLLPRSFAVSRFSYVLARSLTRAGSIDNLSCRARVRPEIVNTSRSSMLGQPLRGHCSTHRGRSFLFR